EMTIAARHFEAATLERERAVGAALRAGDLAAERTAQRFAPRTLPADVLACNVPLERRAANLAMPATVVLALDPRLRRLVQPIERKIGAAFKHRHQARLDQIPERLLLAVLIGRVR